MWCVNILVQESKWLKYVDMTSQLHLQYLKQKNMFRANILPCQAVGFFYIFSIVNQMKCSELLVHTVS